MGWKIRTLAGFSLMASRTINDALRPGLFLDEDRRRLDIKKNDFFCSVLGLHYL